MTTIRNFINYTNYSNYSSDYYLDEFKYPQAFYGRINKNGQPILPFERNSFAPVMNDDPNAAFAIDFVVDAFQDLNTKQLTMQIQDFNNGEGLRPVRGYQDGKSLYFDYIIPIINQFIEEEKRRPDEKKISDFLNFIHKFQDFIENNISGIPIVLSSFVVSNYCPPHVSGLVLNLIQANYDDLDRKEEVDISTSDEFRELALNYGFIIPKNAPWCLVANIESNAMYEYALNYDIEDFEKNKIIGSYFYECRNYDIDLLRSALFDGYQRFIQETKVRTFKKTCKDGSMLPRSIVLPTPIPQEADLDQRQLIPFYFKILCIEKKVKVRQVLFDTIMEDCYYMYKEKGFEVMHDYAVVKLLKTKPDNYR